MAFKASFVVRGIPLPQPRHRATVFLDKDKKPRARVYPDKRADSWKDLIRATAVDHRPEEVLLGPIALRVVCYLPRPKRLYRRKDPDGPVIAAVRPDWDNLGKLPCDVLSEEGWWRDDGQIYDGHVIKMYHAKTSSPCILIDVEEHDV
jgi:Holliday junction resolvase RusA-like endonuclease